jgi:hypothetical protein
LPWAKDTPDSPVSKETAKLLKELKLQRPGLNFYALRHTFETIGGEAKDQVAVSQGTQEGCRSQKRRHGSQSEVEKVQARPSAN